MDYKIALSDFQPNLANRKNLTFWVKVTLFIASTFNKKTTIAGDRETGLH